MVNVLILLALLFVGPPSSGEAGHADPSDPGTDSDKAAAQQEVSEHMVVTAQFKPESARETLIPVNVLDTQDMEGDRDLRELLEAELRLDVQKHSVFGTSLSVGGISHENVAILINGMPIPGRLDGIIDLEQIGLAAFERVEILEGPGSVYYGSEAQGGVVNLIPRRARSGETEISVSAGYRDLGDAQQIVKADFTLGHHDFALTASRRHTNGEDQTKESRNLDWAERRQSSGALSWRRAFAKSTLSWYTDLMEEDLLDLGEFEEGFALDHTYRTKRNNHQLTFEGNWAERVDVHLLAGYSAYDRRRTTFQVPESDASRPEKTPNDPGFNNGFDLMTVKGMVSVTELLPATDAQLGMEWRFEEGTGGRILDDSREIEDYAVFGGFRTRLGQWAIQPMVRVIENSIYRAPTIPSLHIKYTGAQDLIWRTTYSRGFRGPSIKQLFLDFFVQAGPFRYHIMGNENLEAERGHHYSTTLERTLWSSGDFRLEGEMHGFYSDIDNLIALSALQPSAEDPTLIQRHYINVDQHRSRGGDLSLAAFLRQSRLSFGLAHTKTSNTITRDDAPAPSSGRWDSRLQALHQQGDHQFSFLFKRIGEQSGFREVSQGRGQPTRLEEVALAAYERVDLNWRYTWQKRGLTASFGIKNLLDVRDQETVVVASGRSHEVNHLDWGRRYQVELGWRWTGRDK